MHSHLLLLYLRDLEVAGHSGNSNTVAVVEAATGASMTHPLTRPLAACVQAGTWLHACSCVVRAWAWAGVQVEASHTLLSTDACEVEEARTRTVRRAPPQDMCTY